MKFGDIINKIGSLPVIRHAVFWAFFATLVFANVYLFFTEPLPLIVRLTNLILPPSMVLWLLTYRRTPASTYLWLLPLVALNAFQIVILYLFGQSPIAVDMFLNVVTTNPTEANELLYGLLVPLLVLAILYVGAIGTAIYLVVTKKTIDVDYLRQRRRFSHVGAAVGLILLAGCYINDHDFEIEDDIFPLNVTYNLCSAVVRFHEVREYPETSANFRFNAKPSHTGDQKEVYVLVIGETLRAANFHAIGYERNTTPCIDALVQNGAYVFKDALTQCNTTHKSVPMILSSVSAADFNEIKKQKSMLQAFREAGFTTAFFSNQDRNRSYIEFFSREAHRAKFLKDDYPIGTNVSDSCLIEELKNELATDTASRRRLIVLHMYGSHFSYRDRYPADEAYFTPDAAPGASPKYRTELVNAFDNTIRFADKFVGQVADVLNQLNCASTMVFISDHGADLFDDSRNRFLHASPWPTYYQLHVPLVVWMSPQYQALYPEVPAALAENCQKPVGMSLVVFHSMLHMAGIKTPYMKEKHAVTSGNFEVTKRMYLDDHNEGHTLDDIPLNKLDIEAMKQHGVTYP